MHAWDRCRPVVIVRRAGIRCMKTLKNRGAEQKWGCVACIDRAFQGPTRVSVSRPMEASLRNRSDVGANQFGAAIRLYTQKEFAFERRMNIDNRARSGHSIAWLT